MKKSSRLVRLIGSGVLLICVSLFAGQEAAAQSSGGVLKSKIADIVFSELEKQIMEEFFGNRGGREIRAMGEHEDRRKSTFKKAKKRKNKGNKRGLPPGLAKQRRLPPGLARQLERKGTLPPGLAKRDLPRRLDASLPEVWPGTERKIVGNDVVLLEKGTELVLDVLRGVVLR